MARRKNFDAKAIAEENEAKKLKAATPALTAFHEVVRKYVLTHNPARLNALSNPEKLEKAIDLLHAQSLMPNWLSELNLQDLLRGNHISNNVLEKMTDPAFRRNMNPMQRLLADRHLRECSLCRILLGVALGKPPRASFMEVRVVKPTGPRPDRFPPIDSFEDILRVNRQLDDYEDGSSSEDE